MPRIDLNSFRHKLWNFRFFDFGDIVPPEMGETIMSNYSEILYASVPETPVYADFKKPNKRLKRHNVVLMNTWLGITDTATDFEGNDWVKAVTAGKDGWIRREDTSSRLGMKVFFVDVGQGDGCLVEVGDKRYLVDGGPNSNLLRYLAGYQYTYLLRATPPKQVHFDAVFISHFDADHYAGITKIIADPRFTFGTIWHNGIARFQTKKAKRPGEYDTDLGTRTADETHLLTLCDDYDSLIALQVKGGLQATFNKFVEACRKAEAEGRLIPPNGAPKLARLDITTPSLETHDVQGVPFEIEVLGPVINEISGQPAAEWFSGSSHTRNGHSLVLRFQYGQNSCLLTGDLNEESQHHLMHNLSDAKLSRLGVDVAKSCHHGSSDYLTSFNKLVGAPATVISSGDNENYAHPRADAIGSVAKTSRSDFPLIFSTELARSIKSGEDVMYGMIQARSDGTKWVMAQMKEKAAYADLWDSYTLPYTHD